MLKYLLHRGPASNYRIEEYHYVLWKYNVVGKRYHIVVTI